jgi:hypothetical protein
MKKIYVIKILFLSILFSTFFTDFSFAVDGYSLDAVDGSPVDAVYVDNGGNAAFKGDLIVGGDGTVQYIKPPWAGGAIQIKTSAATFDRWISLGLIANDHTTFYPFLTAIDNGNVGIGTITPDYKIDVEGATDSFHAQWGTAAGTYGAMYASDARNFVSIGSRSNDDFRLFTNGVDLMSLTADGNVGIGTTNPSGLLDLEKTGATIEVRDRNSVYTPSDQPSRIILSSRQNLDTYNQPYVGSALEFQMDWNGSTLGNAARIVGRGHWAWGGTLDFDIAEGGSPQSNYVTRMRITKSGNVGIGTTNPANKLDVNGIIRAKEVKVESNWSDFVFEDNYNLPSLNHVESYIKENKHLPDVPSAKQVEEEGLSMSQMMAKQMQKIEELTLYVIEQNKQLSNQNKKLESQNDEIAALKREIAEIKR